jgi:predicted dehydrogenase
MSNKLRVGIIGTSDWADEFYLSNLKSHPNVVLSAVCGQNKTRAEELASKHGVAKVFTDYRRMLNSGDLDVAIICTPEDLHYPMTMAALAARLHVICEKPLAFTESQAREMYEKANEMGVKHMVPFTSRWLPHFRYLKDLLENGYIGRPYHAHFHWLTGWHPDSDSYMWYYNSTHAHGVASQVSSHMIDLARWYLGDIARVKASVSTFVQRPGPKGDDVNPESDSAMLIIEFVNGAHATIHVSTANQIGEGLRHTRQVILLYGQDGTLETRGGYWGPPPASELVGLRRGAERAETLQIPDVYFDITDPASPMQLFEKGSFGPRAFIDAILNDLPISPNFYDG